MSRRPPFECIALFLQGGDAPGSYRAGVYQALTEADPDRVAGYEDALLALRHPEMLQRPRSHDGVATFDLAAMMERASL